MAPSDIDVVGIGNAIVDTFATPEDDEILSNLKLSKGVMNLIDHKMADMLTCCLHVSKEMSGGTVSNTLVGIKSFGGTATFMGKVGNDLCGERFCFELQEKGVNLCVSVAEEASTSESFIVVDPQGFRTMATYISPDCCIKASELDLDVISRAKIVYLAGYIMDLPEGKEIWNKVIEVTRGKNIKIALTLADYECVTRHKSDFLHIISNDVDFLFANTQEINALFNARDRDESLNYLISVSKTKDAMYCITAGKDHSIIVNNGKGIRHPTEKIEKVVDKTGAGAAFASGVLYGHLEGYDTMKCAELGNAAAAQVLSSLGARPSSEFVLLLDNYQSTGSSEGW